MIPPRKPIPPVSVLALRREGAAKSLGISVRLLADLTAQNLIPHVRLGRAVVYPVADLQKWLSDKAAEGQKP